MSPCAKRACARTPRRDKGKGRLVFGGGKRREGVGGSSRGGLVAREAELSVGRFRP